MVSAAGRHVLRQTVLVPDFELPRDLVREMERFDPPDAPRRAWVATLPDVVAALAEEWALEAVGRPYQPGGVASWVAPVRTANGELCVLKVGWAHDESTHEPDALRLWDGRGAVRLITSRMAGSTSALLLEACRPGTTLASSLEPARQHEVVANLLRRLWIEPEPGHPFRSLADMCAAWADEFQQKLVTLGSPDLDPGVMRAGIESFRSLPGTADRAVLLCTDLHHENVLAAEREPWLTIDPKPYVGDPTFDALQHMLNFPDRLALDPLGFVGRMSQLLAVDPDRLRHWLFARCVLESIDSPELVAVAAALAL